MSKIKLQPSLTFDDVLLLPQYSQILPTQTDTSIVLSATLKLHVPMISSAMDTVTEFLMAKEMALLGGLGIVHKNMDIASQAEIISLVKICTDVSTPLQEIFGVNKSTRDPLGRLQVGAAIGVSDKEKERAKALIAAGVDLLVVDTAHGHSKGVIEMVKWVKEFKPNLSVAAGNIATPEGAKALCEAGADIVKIGIGPGSICTTRIVAGVGVPQLQAILDCVEVCHQARKTVIADGGIRYSGDLSKAIAAGADAVMLGSLLAGVNESPGEKIFHEDAYYKKYRGMGSLGAMVSGSKDRYGQAEVGQSNKLVSEGVEGLVPYTGDLSGVIYQLWGGLRASLGYLGAADIKTYRDKASFITITQAGKIESYPHSLLLGKHLIK